MSNLVQFEVTCKNCGSKDVDLDGYCGQNMGFGILICRGCDEEESVDQFGNKH